MQIVFLVLPAQKDRDFRMNPLNGPDTVTARKMDSNTYKLLCAPLRAFAATPMTFRTSVLVLAFSNASLWNSIVVNVPSICCSCFSNLFFLFRAANAAVNQHITLKLNNLGNHGIYSFNVGAQSFK